MCIVFHLFNAWLVYERLQTKNNCDSLLIIIVQYRFVSKYK